MGLSLGGLCLETALTRELRFFGRAPAAPPHPLLGRAGVSYAPGVGGPPPPGSLLVLAVPDAALDGVAAEWASAGRAPQGAVALHLSGALPSSVLQPLRARGYAVGALHPLQTVAAPDERGTALRGIAFAFEGEAAARPAADAIARAAGGHNFDVPAGEKAKYHAACVFAANYVVANAGVAARLLAEAASIPEADALAALLPLMEGALRNLKRVGLPRALTGPIARGDVEVVRRQLAALDAPTRVLYSAAAREALRLARSAGLDTRRADEIERVLDTQR
jgi:predicted short-subunit dehydrogenase-like oxidoreductase (DUF2520 family)